MKNRFVYENEYTNEISFPLGGIGAGSIGLAGNGRLIDWEIFNRPNKDSRNGMSHFAVKAEQDGKLISAKVLQGDLHPHYIGEAPKAGSSFTGYGWGPMRENMCGMPHFRNHKFIGKYPFAKLQFGGEEDWPGDVSLHAFSPFIPGDSYTSSIPTAIFEVELHNTTEDSIDYTVVGAISNPFGREDAKNSIIKSGNMHQLTLSNTKSCENSTEYGDITLSTDSDDVSYQEYWYRGAWCDDLEIYWQDLNAVGKFKNRSYTKGAQRGYTNMDTGHIASHLTLESGEKRTVRYAITWHVPNCTNYWTTDDNMNANSQSCRRESAGIAKNWKNYYATQWKDSIDSGRHVFDNYDYIKNSTRTFADNLFSSTLPDYVLESISANLSTLKSPTSLRLEDGTFYGWEGTGCTAGSCEGSCTHVWNYTQALPFLFPDLERSMRSANYTYSIDDAGGAHFRIILPLGIQAIESDFRPCADGQFGDVIKTYRDWKISGDDKWLEGLWPNIKRTIEYAWSDKNPDMWDINKTGVLWGRQHHTLDMELFGVNAWLSGYYVAALKAGARMASHMGEHDFAETCYNLFEKGKRFLDENVYNGEYYYHLIDMHDEDILNQYDKDKRHTVSGDSTRDAYWDEEHSELKYQIGEGCYVNTVIAQWHADLYGLGEVLDRDKVKSTLAAIYKYNFVEKVRDIANPWRIYALNDESALQICSWPKHVNRPMIPLPYAQEDQGGYTYAAAIHMIGAGLVDEGQTVVKAIRDKYNGQNRNPWNEIECGSNYARAMASYSLLNVYSGFEYDMTQNMIGFNPIDSKDFNCFWSLGTAWGNIEYSEDISINILGGELVVKEIRIDDAYSVQKVIGDGNTVKFNIEDGSIKLEEIIKVNNSITIIRK